MNTEQQQQRYIESPLEHVRQEGENGEAIKGYAAVYNEFSRNLGGFIEMIEPGAFPERAMQDTKCYFNHSRNKILGRVSNGTLMLETDAKGLRYECELASTTAGKDVGELVKRRDVPYSSFAFYLERSEWELLPEEMRDEESGLYYLHRVIEVKELVDVSPVTDPAYLQASADIRSHIPDSIKKELRRAHRSERSMKYNYNHLQLIG